ncbi:MAG: outer membrane lipoprotein carrier protein LolA [Deltaproteobacteria bacterium]|nr:outer membrane lipoprotein carrier protein LolA [Deltaproteobacteria bacterium]
MRKTTVQSWVQIFLISGLIVLLSGTVLQAQEKEELSGILEKLKNQFGASRTFKAEYVRDLLPKVSSVLPSASMKAEGTLLFASPNKLRLEQQKPRPEQLISNGEKVWWYIPAEKTVQIFSLKDHGQQVKPITDFFSGLGGLEKHFNVRLDKTTPEEAPFYSLTLAPKTPQPDLNQITLRISKETLLPLEFTFFNLLGDGTRFRFSQVQTGAKIPATAFQFTPPKGTQVINPPAGLKVN